MFSNCGDFGPVYCCSLFHGPQTFYSNWPQRSVAKGQIKPKSILAQRRFSQTKGMDEFDLFAVKSKKANKSNSFVRFFGEVSRS